MKHMLLALGIVSTTQLFAGAKAAPLPPVLTPPEVLGKAKTIQCAITFRMAIPGVTGGNSPNSFAISVAMEQPNKMAEKDADPKTGEVDVAFVSDGRTLVGYNKEHNSFYRKNAAANWGQMALNSIGLPIMCNLLLPKQFIAFHKIGAVTIDGKPAVRYRKQRGKASIPGYVDAWIDAKTGLPMRCAAFIIDSGKTYEVEQLDFSDWKMNEPISPVVFTFTLPDSANEQPPP